MIKPNLACQGLCVSYAVVLQRLDTVKAGQMLTYYFGRLDRRATHISSGHRTVQKSPLLLLRIVAFISTEVIY